MMMSTGGQPGKGIFLSVVSSEFEAYEVGKYLTQISNRSIDLSHHVCLCTKGNRNQIEFSHLNAQMCIVPTCTHTDR